MNKEYIKANDILSIIRKKCIDLEARTGFEPNKIIVSPDIFNIIQNKVLVNYKDCNSGDCMIMLFGATLKIDYSLESSIKIAYEENVNIEKEHQK